MSTLLVDTSLLRVELIPDSNAPCPLEDEPFTLASWAANVPSTVARPSDTPASWAAAWHAAHPDGELRPLWAYRHGAIALRCAPDRNATGFPDPLWDVGFVGYVVLSAETVRAEWDGDWTRAWAYVDAVLRVLEQWLNGDVWGYRILRPDATGTAWAVADSCYGFFGDDWTTNGMINAWPTDVRAAVRVAGA